MEGEQVCQEEHTIRKEQSITEVASENKDLTFNTEKRQRHGLGNEKRI